MSDRPLPRIAKWPFLIGDLVLLGLAATMVVHGQRPLEPGMVWICFLSVLGGALLSVLPFVLEYKAAERTAQADHLQSALEQIQNLELISSQIGSSLVQLHTVLEECAKTVSTSGALSDRITAEARSFQEFLTKANDNERNTLRLEIDKLKRSETEWLQVTTGILDHIFALHQAAVRSSQPELSRQIGKFQRACKDLARRTGLVPFAPEERQPFDPSLHHPAEGDAAEIKEGTIARVLASGYSYQGQMLRRALVSLQAAAGMPGQSAPITTAQSISDGALGEGSPNTVSGQVGASDLSIADLNAKAHHSSGEESKGARPDGQLL